jgi:Mitochondrial carrier protein
MVAEGENVATSRPPPGIAQSPAEFHIDPPLASPPPHQLAPPTHRITKIQHRTSIPSEFQHIDDLTISDLDSYGEQHEEHSTMASESAVFSPPARSLDSSTVAIPETTIGNKGLIRFRSNASQLPHEVRTLLAGGIAGMMAKSVVAPVDRIKILYQVSATKFHWYSVPLVVRNIIRNEGYAALWKGNLATMIRVFPYSGIQFATFDQCKAYILKHRQRSDAAKPGLTPGESLQAGMIAGAVSVLCTYPLDLARSQLAVLKHKRHVDTTKNIGLIGILRENYQQRGLIRGLFRGVLPTLAGILPYSGIAFALNEQGKREVRVFDIVVAAPVYKLLPLGPCQASSLTPPPCFGSPRRHPLDS